jgi:hypothetical protein
MPQRARDGGAAMPRMDGMPQRAKDGRTDICSSITAPALSYYRTSCTYAISALPPSVAVVLRKEPGMAVRCFTRS